ncbi:MAG: hypothetical protein BAJALOKI1v1_2020007 [Promethearchaeota archaeon]|nr:MAG: hypothetical protein BAJALOKI1v1_2020007 [Candidatus Lokiarchaeota archaeon]
MSKTNKIIVDSNFILVPIQFKIDYIDEMEGMLEGSCEFIIFQQVLDELRAKQKRRQHSGKNSLFETQLRAGLSYLEQRQAKHTIHFYDRIKDENETTDGFLLRMIETFRENHRNVYFATNDYELRTRACRICPVFFVRQEKFLSLS